MNRSLIIFAKFPEIGTVKTRLGREIGMEQATEVYRQLSARTFAVADTMRHEGVGVHLFFAPGYSEQRVREWVGFPFHYHEQQGADLGERMGNAFEAVFKHQESRIVIIGTDAPDLDGTIINSAFDALDGVDVVIGPTPDGGYYLLGMNFPSREVFRNITWSSGSVRSDTIAHIDRLNWSLTLLPELGDVDTIEDYYSMIENRKSLNANLNSGDA